METLPNHEQIEAQVDELFLESDREVIRILSRLLELLREDDENAKRIHHPH